MSRRWGWRLAGALAVVAMVTTGSVPPSPAAPNPYGRRSAETTIVLHPDGSYHVTLQQTQVLVREFGLTFGGGVHDGFRLPDDGSKLPPYLRATYALTGFTVAPGQPVPPDFTRTNHLASVTSRGTYPAGTHRAEISYRVTGGAARPTEDGWLVHIRLLGIGYSDGDRVEIRAAETQPTRLNLRCVTLAPDSEPCGTLGGTTLIDVFTDNGQPDLSPEFLVEVTAPNNAVPEPQIDRR